MHARVHTYAHTCTASALGPSGGGQTLITEGVLRPRTGVGLAPSHPAGWVASVQEPRLGAGSSVESMTVGGTVGPVGGASKAPGGGGGHLRFQSLHLQILTHLRKANEIKTGGHSHECVTNTTQRRLGKVPEDAVGGDP